MDAQRFLANFGHLVNAPGGVSRLRGLILQFAISGKLSERLPNDTPAEVLLKQNLESQRRLVVQQMLKRQHAPKNVTETEVPWGLPEGWIWTRLGAVTNYGNAPKCEYSDVTKDIWVLELEDIEKETSRLITRVRAQDRKFKSTKNGFPAGAVLYGKLRPYLDKVLIADEPGVCTTEINPISFFEGIDAAYLRWYLKSPYFVSYANGSTYGMNLPRMGTDTAREALLPLPPKLEQNSIITKVDELMALCDKLEAQQQDRNKLQTALRQSSLRTLSEAISSFELYTAWERVATNMNSLLASPDDVSKLIIAINDLAIRGLLNPQDEIPFENSVESMLKYFAVVKTRKRMAKMENAEESYLLPKGWRWVQFEELLNGSDSGWSPKCDEVPRKQGEWGVLKVSAVTWGIYKPHENKRLPVSMDPRPECEVKAGDFLLSRANTAELIARSVIAPSDSPNQLMMSDKIVRLEFIDPELKPWANLVNNSQFAREYYRQRATGTSDSMRNVSRQTIHELPIPLPPKPVQIAIMQTLNRLIDRCRDLEMKIAEERRSAEEMAKASISSLTGINIAQVEDTNVKLPKNELLAFIRSGTAPSVSAHAPLTTILSRHNGEMSAHDLFQRYGNEDIEAFYAQLKMEVAHGWIQEPAVAEMRELVPATES